MSINRVLNLHSMADVRDKIRRNGWSDCLEALYAAYSGCRSLAEKQAAFDDTFAQHPIADEEDRIYLQHICHMIWVQDKGKSPSSLLQLSRDNVRFLAERRVDMSGWTSDGEGMEGCWGAPNATWLNGREPISGEWYKAFPLARFLTEGCRDQTEAVIALLKWELKNFFHAYSDPSSGEIWDWSIYDLDPRDWAVPLDAYFRERIIGCHGGAKIFCAMLRSINIPAIEVHYGGHGIVFIPTLDRYIHGDYIADFTVLPDVSSIIMTREELESWIFSPEGYISYFSHLQEQGIPHAGITLRRRERSLFVATGSAPDVVVPAGEPYHTQILNDLEEYEIHEVNGLNYSNFIPIRNLSDLPDYPSLRPASRLDKRNFLEITLRNEGQAFVPSGRGHLDIAVTDVPAERALKIGKALGSLADQNFRRPGGRTTINTAIRLRGAGRRVRTALDRIDGPCRDALVTDEVLNAAEIHGVDLAIQDIALDAERRLYVLIANAGNHDGGPGLRVRMSMNIRTAAGNRRLRFFHDFAGILKPHAVNSQRIYPPPPVMMDVRGQVEVAMVADNFEDLDTTNNYLKKTFG